ncbi:MAG: RNB domain-containing ribonuclease, partial [Actinomycetota bacterium]|nr:RNB domain-containing ribonuclease [Actinomycetota bacterium]
ETHVPFCTIDPLGSMDLDQALHIERSGDGYRVRYAIADVPAFVVPGGAVDAEARSRAVTVYAPDQRAPLHPPQLSEGAASLLEGVVRPAFVWDLLLGGDGEVTSTDLYRAVVRSTDRFHYRQVQEAVDAGTDDQRLLLLREVGERRIELEGRRGGASLPLPEQEVTQDADGAYVLSFRPPVPAEDWNAQLSLMTGMAAARIMLDGGIGLLRTMPAPEEAAVARFRRQTLALGVEWPQGEPYGELLRRLDRTDPLHLALVHEATALFRGAGYTPFEGQPPSPRTHAAVAAPYAHVTAPLRRLVDRFGLVVCEALVCGDEVPSWAREALPELPGLMRAGGRQASAVERASTDAVEAAVMTGHVGETFPAVVVDQGRKGAVVVQLSDPAIVGQAQGSAEPGAEVSVRCDGADVSTGTVTLSLG